MFLMPGTNLKKKILTLLLAALLLFSPIAPGKAFAVNSLTGATPIPSGNFLITTDGNYQLRNGYKGIVTIAPTASKVKVIGSSDGKTLAEASIAVASRTGPFELTVENLKLSAPAAKSAIDFDNVPGLNYNIWPYNKSNADQPAPYSRTDTLLVSGVCSLTGGSGGAGVRVGDGVHLIIDKAAGLSDDNACLSALGGENGPGIGGNSGFFSGSVSINGGTITATGGLSGVGLGDLTGAVTINGGEVTAISHAEHRPGIGNRGYLGGMWLNGASSVLQFTENSSLILPGETIVINGGSVTASADNYPGIFAMSGMKDFSGGFNVIDRKNSLGRLIINGGTVTARGSYTDYIYNAAIQGSRIEINGGSVSAINDQGAGLSGVSTVINGGFVFAVGNAPVDLFADLLSPSEYLKQGIDQINKALDEGGAPEEAENALNQFFSFALNAIFGGSSAANEGGGSGIAVFPDDSLTINDGMVVAQGGPNSAGIGRAGMGTSGGLGALFGQMINTDLTPGPITINGGSVFATGGKDGAGLGGGGKIYVGGRPTVIATRGGDAAHDVWAELIQERSSGASRAYLRLEVKDKSSGKPLAGKKVTVAGVPYFSNTDGVIGCFIPRPLLKSGGYSPVKISAIALAPSGFPGAATEIIPRENSLRAAIDLDFPLHDITLKGVSGDNPADIPLQLTPAFDPQQTNYAVYVENSVKSVKITPEKVPGDAVTTVQVNGIAVKAGESAEVPLQFGENNILVTVSLPAEEWAPEAIPVQKQYFIKVNRANMKIAPNALTINSGDAAGLVVQYDDSYTGERSGTWSVADSSIISVEESNTEPIIINPKHTIPGTVGAKVTGLKPGVTTVTFTNTATGISRDCTVTVNPAFKITPDPLTVYIGETGSLAVTFDDGYKGSRTGSWSVDDNTVASIDQNGVVTGKKAGTAIVTYASGLAPATSAGGNGSGVNIETAARVKSAYDIVKTASVVVKPGTFTVNFDPNGGSPKPESVTVKHDTTIVRLDDPSRSGMRFVGWYTALNGGSQWDFANDKVTADMTLYAHWALIPTFSTSSHRPSAYAAPTITGPDAIDLTEGYASIDQAYAFGGYPAPTYGISPTEPNTANATFAGNTLTIPEGLGAGSYEVTLFATNSVGTATKTVTVKVSPAAAPTLPTITGPDTINLLEGYDSIDQAYTFGGDPAPTYSISDTEPNTANATLTGNTLTIPAGLGAGSYAVTLFATNSVGTVTKTVAVIVSPAETAPTITGPDAILLPPPYTSDDYPYTVTGSPTAYGITNISSSPGFFSFDGVNLSIASGLDYNDSPFTLTLTATNSAGTATKDVTVYVIMMEPTSFGVDEGDTKIEALSVTGAGSYTLSLQNAPAWVSLSGNTLTVSPPAGTLTGGSPEDFTADIVITVSGGETYTTPIYITVNP